MTHIGRILYQFSSAYIVTHLPIPSTASPDFEFKATSMNSQLSLGPLLLLFGFLTRDLSAIQSMYLDNVKLAKKPNISSWNLSVINSLFEYSQSLWKFRSEILHNESIFTQEAMLRDQAIQLLHSIRSTLYLSLQKGSTDYLKTTTLYNVISWTKQMNQSLEDQNFDDKTTSNGIRT